MRRFLALTMLPITLGAQATCVTPPLEIGDIGPSYTLVCAELERRFPDAALAVEDLAIHSPTQVSVIASVDSQPMPMRYSLTGYIWALDESGLRTADAASAPDSPAVPR